MVGSSPKRSKEVQVKRAAWKEKKTQKLEKAQRIRSGTDTFKKDGKGGL